MAPSKCTRKQPAHRAAQGPPTARAGLRGNHVVLDEIPQSDAPAASFRTPKRKLVARVKKAAIVKSKAPPKAQPKAKLPSGKRECLICATSKTVSRSFRLTGKSEVCTHFQGVCNLCIQKMLNTKIAEHKLSEPDLACPFPKCEHSLDTSTLKQVCTNKLIIEHYEEALVKYQLSANPDYIACLSPTCGTYFSVEDCQGSSRSKAKRTTKRKTMCPHCDYEICLTCNRPWHASTGCDKAKQKEDADSVEQIKTMGAKPRPKCGMNIEKDGGCDHMTCRTCRHNFCWLCLAPYDSIAQHAPGCTHGRRDVAIDPRNWAQADMTDAQLIALIEQAHDVQFTAERNGPLQEQNVAPWAAPWAPHNGQPINQENTPPPIHLPPGATWFPANGNFAFGAGLFNAMFGGANGGNV